MSLAHNSLGGQFRMVVPKSASSPSSRQSSRRRSASACGKLSGWLCDERLNVVVAVLRMRRPLTTSIVAGPPVRVVATFSPPSLMQ